MSCRYRLAILYSGRWCIGKHRAFFDLPLARFFQDAHRCTRVLGSAFVSIRVAAVWWQSEIKSRGRGLLIAPISVSTCQEPHATHRGYFTRLQSPMAVLFRSLSFSSAATHLESEIKSRAKSRDDPWRLLSRCKRVIDCVFLVNSTRSMTSRSCFPQHEITRENNLDVEFVASRYFLCPREQRRTRGHNCKCENFALIIIAQSNYSARLAFCANDIPISTDLSKYNNFLLPASGEMTR